jgi:hypothetical protein
MKIKIYTPRIIAIVAAIGILVAAYYISQSFPSIVRG